MIKLKRLESEDDVFSVESDNTFNSAEKEVETIIKQKKLKELAKELTKKFSVRKLGSTSDSQEFEGNSYYILHIKYVLHFLFYTVIYFF